MSTAKELKAFLKTNNVKGYSNKNKEELLQMVEEFKSNQNLFNRLPNVNISQIGQYLNFSNTLKTQQLQKNFKTNLIAQYRTCAKVVGKGRYYTLYDYLAYKFNIFRILENLAQQSPNLTYLELEFDLSDIDLIIAESEITSEVVELLTLLKNCKKLNFLDIKFNRFIIYQDYNSIVELLGSFNLQFLSIDIDLYYYENILLLGNNLKYLELELVDGDAYDFNEMKVGMPSDIRLVINTLDLKFGSFYDFSFNLVKTPNLKRLILSGIDYGMLENLINVQDIQVLEYDHFDNESSAPEQWQHRNQLPKDIKYLRCGNLERKDENNFYDELLNYISPDYLIQEFRFISSERDLLYLLSINFKEIKYLHIKRISFSVADFNINYEDIKNLYFKINIKISFDELSIDKDKVLGIDKIIKLFGWNLKLISEDSEISYNKLENYYSPNEWLIDHGFMLRPHCD